MNNSAKTRVQTVADAIYKKFSSKGVTREKALLIAEQADRESNSGDYLPYEKRRRAKREALPIVRRKVNKASIPAPLFTPEQTGGDSPVPPKPKRAPAAKKEVLITSPNKTIMSLQLFNARVKAIVATGKTRKEAIAIAKSETAKARARKTSKATAIRRARNTVTARNSDSLKRAVEKLQNGVDAMYAAVHRKPRPKKTV